MTAPLLSTLPKQIIGITPFGIPDVGLAVALSAADATPILDLGADESAARAAMGELSKRLPKGFGVLVGSAEWRADALPEQARWVITAPGVSPSGWEGRAVVAQVTSLAEARTAIAAGAQGLIAKGSESAGRVGEETCFILLQQLLEEIDLPIWAQGGVGLHSAAACIAGGAHGLVLDTQLAHFPECRAPAELKRALAPLDGSETRVVEGRRVFEGRTAKDVAGPAFPVGQEVAFARALAARFGSIRGLVRGIERAVEGHLRQAQRLAPLAPGSPLANAHGIDVPILQGPMTRVSDRSAFARAVSDAGGLPFLALALMRGHEVRELLRETAELLEGRTWGVGILGFVPPDLREEQLAAVKEARPPVALIAGGRPSQSQPLEDLGIPTYLHVPSIGLLDLFLKDGARRFIFEGRECGGHVGPRSSLVLWEAAVERLLAVEDLSRVTAIFAGGIHDARSAAMVSALAAPLAARGAQIGVLMGTAYLFTAEAVATGAITPEFQAQALACEQTVLLETAPGHATRCADTAYAKAFEAERARLEQEGQIPQKIWEGLEQLNLGRLRLASKGLRREGEVLVGVDSATQRTEGMFMIGQVAALRGDRCTMADLHRDISVGSRQWLAAREIPEPRRSPEGPARVAIVGMACIFPQAPNLAAFWKNVCLGTNAVTEVPPERWSSDRYYSAQGTGRQTPSRWGGFIPPVAFDPAKYGIPPRSLSAIDPIQLLGLEVAHQALADAGYAERPFDRERTSVIFGAEAGADLANAYGFRALYPQLLGALPPELDAALPSLTEDSFAGVLANVIAGRIANRLDLGGVNYTVDAACASSLAAVDLACKELTSGRSEMVICGGADLHNSINDYLLFSSVHALSATGQCRTFDASADGIVLGEGVAALVLKRFEDAERDGDRIYAVIQGVGGSSDGKSLGLTAPRKEGQIRALERAYEQAGVSPAQVELVEAHGTGTVVGDRTELATLTELFVAAGAEPKQCTLGSVKSQIGHTKCAAGLAGMIKAALSVHAGVLPPTSNVEKPNPYYDGASSPFAFRARTSPWVSERRRAGVSAFGFGGTNFHVVLEDAGRPAGPADEWPVELFVFRGPDRTAAMASLEDVERCLDRGGQPRLRDLALTAASAHPDAPVQVAIVARELGELRLRLRAARVGDAKAEGVFLADGAHAYASDQIAFLYPGQGSQRPGMLSQLYQTFPWLGDVLRPGRRWMDAIHPPASFSPEERAAHKAAVTDTRVAQPALGIAGLTLTRLLDRCGVTALTLAGHSYGELVALAVAGAIPEDQLLELSEARALAILDAAGGKPGTMAAVMAPATRVREVLRDCPGATIANENAPEQVVIAGSHEAVAEAQAKLEAAGISTKRLEVACAFHSPIVAGAVEAFAQRLTSVKLAAPKRRVFANSDARPYSDEPSAIAGKLSGQIGRPVLFAEEIEAMYAAGIRCFVEAGPGRVLTDLVGKILRGRPHLAVACDGVTDSSLEGFLTALGRLAAAHVPMDVKALFAGRDARSVDLQSSFGPSATAWMVDGFSARPVKGELPEFAMRLPSKPLAVAASALPAGGQDEVVLNYLEGVRTLVESQRQVMLQYLGRQAAGPQPVVQHVETRILSRTPPPAASAIVAAAATRSPMQTAQLTPLEALVAAVSERTGYPPDMLEPDLDLEADLGIDSIKRIEILGGLAERLGIRAPAGSTRSEMMEQLAPMKTLRKMAEWFDAQVATAPKALNPSPTADPVAPPQGSPPGEAAATAVSPSVEPSPDAADAVAKVGRWIFELGRLPEAEPNGVRVAGKTFAIAPDRGGVAFALAEILEGHGAKTVMVDGATELDRVDGLLHLEGLEASSPNWLRSLFDLTQRAMARDAHWIVAATGLGGGLGRSPHSKPALGGAAGMLKSVAKERPGLKVKSIDLGPDGDPQNLATHIFQEMVAASGPVEVGYSQGVRQAVRAVESPAKGASAGPRLSPESVIVLTGGGRGITAEIAVALAQRFHCRLELLGRTELSDEKEDPYLADVRDPAELRRRLLERAHGAGTTSPGVIESQLRQLLAEREIRKTLARIERAGGRGRYQSVDVRSPIELGDALDGLYAEHGRIDGAIHGAGVTEDKLVAQKTPESFDRVTQTKLNGAHTLAAKLRDDAQFLIFFSSISGAFGNRGQSDYAAANDALDKLAHALRQTRKTRVSSINWGPWSGVGMVSAELEREYQRQGIGLVPPSVGVEMFVEELLRGDDAQVVLSAANPEILE